MISIVYDIFKYRKALNEIIKDNDRVIEIGPHLGSGTQGYLERTELTIAVDKSKQAEMAFKHLEKRFKNLKYINGDVRSFDTIKEVLKLTDCCDTLAIDMGGGRYPDTVFKVWSVWSGIFKPKNSVIRNRGLAEFVQRAKIKDDSIKKDFPDSGWMSTWGRAIPYSLKKQLDEFKFWVDITK